jgi:hypothetical protein
MRRLLALLPLVILLIMSLSSCSFLPKDLNLTPTPLMPAQVAASLAVAIEDHYEDPACDAVTTSPLEAMADVLAAPWWVPWTILAFDGSLVWGLVDFIREPTQPVDFAHRFQQIREWVPIHFAGVEPPLDGQTPTVPPACSRA